MDRASGTNHATGVSRVADIDRVSGDRAGSDPASGGRAGTTGPDHTSRDGAAPDRTTRAGTSRDGVARDGLAGEVRGPTRHRRAAVGSRGDEPGRASGAGGSSGHDDDAADDLAWEEPLPDADRLITEAVGLAGEARDDAALVRRYWRFAPDEELVGHTPAQMLADVRAHRELAAQRVPGQLNLRVGETADGESTVLEIVTDDMPFLVDSVTAALSTRGLGVHLLVHPLVVVRREPLGALREVRAEAEAQDAAAPDLVESWMRLEIDRVRDPAARDDLRRDLHRVLTDVREAVEDWPRMRSAALALADQLTSAALPVPDRDITDSVELLRWLVDDHFTFLGYREYQLDGPHLRAVLGTGLGILRADQPTPRVLTTMTAEAQAQIREKRLLVITKANSRSTVHRSAYLDYIGFKTFDAEGNVTGERRFLGLFSSAAYLGSVRDLPVVRRKVDAVLERSGLSPRGHSGKDLMAILEDYPRDELFQIRTDELYDAVLGVLRLAGRRALRLFLRRDGYGRFISCLVYLPRDRFTTENRLAMQEILLRELNGVGLDYATRVGESPLARLHFIVRTDPADPPGPGLRVEAIQEQLVEATRDWDDDLRVLLERKLGDDHGREVFARYADAFPDAYKDEHHPREAVKDIAKLDLLEAHGELATHIFRRRNAEGSDGTVGGGRHDGAAGVRFKVFRYGEPMMLSAVLPVLHSLGVRVADERPYEIHRTDGTIHLYDFGLVLPDGARELPLIRPHLQNAFSSTWRGEAEVDGFNELVVRAGLTWRQVVILRAYARYRRQAGAVYSQESMEAALRAHPHIAVALVELFETRFHPSGPPDGADRELRAKELVDAITADLDAVESLDQDRILRGYLALIQATLRTSFFQRAADGRPKPYVAFKLEPRAVPELPAPRPRYEIWVYSPQFEGVHLRFGPVARGGLRWSDRRDDFRTEILGLVKAQTVKNAVIVPVGAKGGFVLKQAPAGRDAFQAEGVTRYQQFISAMLDVTDNLVDGVVVPPPDVVRHDDDDPYLVVAADKGTATFSDLANEISRSYGFWLGDAFASGGSAGYDHKKMGITARGGWVSVERHFRELEVNLQEQDFTVVGIGDMSGDVFGNGMLLSRHIKLVAAFDHRHIFLDPDPDPARSFAERQRLFELPRSSWADYDTGALSEGGGVFPRTLKSIPISAAVRAALGLPDDVLALSPPELIRAILTAPVDLLWNGGIGTYVKAAGESHADVGDKANDAIRVDGGQLRVRVVGEGGNLGMTQRGRIEYARAGGRLCTDFIDNSAGVDCSDHEVNIKILLAGARLDRPARDALLAEMTDEVAELVLRDNYLQATALGSSRAQAHSLLPVHRRMLADMERAGVLDRALEALPSDDELVERQATGVGLTSPEFAVLLSYVKIALEAELESSPLADEPWTVPTLVDYFPTPLRERFTAQMSGHRLHRDIVITQLVNEVVNRGGSSFVYRAVEETGATPADVIRAYVIAREVYQLPVLWDAVERLDNRVPTAAQTMVYLEIRRLLDRAVRWLVTSRRATLDVSGEIERLGPGVAALLPRLDSLFRGREREALVAQREALVSAGVPGELAERVTRVMYGFGLLDIVSDAGRTGRDITEVAEVYFVLSERLRMDDLLSKISALPREDRWQTMARMALRYDLYGALAALTNEALSSTQRLTAGGSSARSVPAAGTSVPRTAPVSAEDRVVSWERANAGPVARTHEAIEEFEKARPDLASLSVLLRQIRTLVRTAAA